MTEQVAVASPRSKVRLAGVLYALTFLSGSLAFFVRGGLNAAASLVAAACYIGVTLLFYVIFKPVNRGLSLLAACFSLVGCAIGPLSRSHLVPFNVSPLVFFGFYCLLIGSLIFRSTFLPRILGLLMVFAGLGWLTFLHPPLANRLVPYNMAPGFLGEGVLTIWLLVKGVDVPRWMERASSTGERTLEHA